MEIYNLFLIVQNDVIVIGVADKTDDKMIIYHGLSNLQSKFVKRYNSKGELIGWDGRLIKFKDFNMVIRDLLKDGQIGVVKNNIPIFKIYKKSFLKLFGLKNLKKIQLKEEIYKKVKDNDGKKSWNKDIRLPEQSISQGLLTQLQYKIAHLFNGFNTSEDIAHKMNLPIEEIYKILKKIDELGLISYIELI
ncbi:MAG: hypothetical protein ACFFBP_01120 [Promethearchaeota archaeon]